MSIEQMGTSKSTDFEAYKTELADFRTEAEALVEELKSVEVHSREEGDQYIEKIESLRIKSPRLQDKYVYKEELNEENHQIYKLLSRVEDDIRSKIQDAIKPKSPDREISMGGFDNYNKPGEGRLSDRN